VRHAFGNREEDRTEEIAGIDLARFKFTLMLLSPAAGLRSETKFPGNGN
jgi:hypothetical protein